VLRIEEGERERAKEHQGAVISKSAPDFSLEQV